METKEKVIVKYFQKDHENTLKHLSRLNSLLADFAEKYEAFEKETGMPPLNQRLLKSLVEQGRWPLEGSIESFVSNQPKPLQSTYRQSLLKELAKLDFAIDNFQKWVESINSVTRYPSDLKKIENLPWNGLKLELNQNYFDSIKGHFELVLESEVDQGLWVRAEALRLAYNEFYLFADQHKRMVPKGFNALFGVHPTFPVTEVNPHPENFLPSRPIGWKP
ncbi:hypothetical protein FHS59_002743 [Algoriphagus iocasae]|uniref:Uncharacterized protein n=1 Tax=Algoriphagus iocasae TaxID=1836499 RepID=A0A841MXB8_9BACT|nr:hypothetical protein [Algoriphagus iocasae]MBB6327115.1 hypothetical protein [Algoriphagus iocasae]